MYCKNCGKQIDDNSKFCQFCGATIAGEEKHEDEQSQATRRAVFDGTIHKCPNCGQVLGSFAAICPTCGYEIQKEYDEKDAINVFAKKMISANSLEEKTNCIASFNVPNTKRDLVEFSDYVIASIKPFNETNEALLTMMSKILYKAEHLFEKDSPLYSEFQAKYNKAQTLYDEAKRIEKDENKQKAAAEKKAKRKENIKYAIKNETKLYRFVMLIIGLVLITVGCLLLLVPKGTDGSFTVWSYIGMGVLLLAIIELVFVFKKKKDGKSKK